jgi:probable H4MPT-linked C1 transfer pathway protein
MRWLGLDIGGANLKAADRHGWVRSMPFPLWRDPHGLADALASLIQAAPPSAALAITMTGELCDCFRSKAEGVRHILSAVDDVAAGRDVLVYLLDGRFVPVDEAQSVPQLAAASNWHVLARFACRFVHGRTGVLIDIGSTTTDIVPLKDGRPFPAAFTDTERLFAGELVYTGVGRTPVCAVVDALPWRGRKCPVAAELFASSADAYVLLGDIPAEPEATWTADGRPLTAEFARERLARMICADAHELSAEDALSAAVCVRDAQLAQLRAALRRVLTARRLATHCIILSGSGEFLARRLIEDGAVAMTVVSLAARLGETASRCAAAHALAVLAERHE